MKDKTNEITGEDIRQVISKWTGIPLNTLGSKEKNALLLLDKELKKKVIGQDEACENVANAVKRARTGIIDTDRPWASFLFLGPTGVGKTELAKVLAGELFGDCERLIQIDMSEMMEMHSVSKLIGSPPGYVGFQQGGRLTEEVKRYPHSVILFDEIEKAHPEILNLFLQIFDEGRLTSAYGETVDFTNAIIICTSNIGSQILLEALNEPNTMWEEAKERSLLELRQSLRPELLNRFDDIIVFEPHDSNKLSQIAVLELNALAKRLAEKDITIKWVEQIPMLIASKSNVPGMGARPMKRYIQDKIEGQIAKGIIEQEIKPGQEIEIPESWLI